MWPIGVLRHPIRAVIATREDLTSMRADNRTTVVLTRATECQCYRVGFIVHESAGIVVTHPTVAQIEEIPPGDDLAGPLPARRAGTGAD
jgi:hypothetical protein